MEISELSLYIKCVESIAFLENDKFINCYGELNVSEININTLYKFLPKLADKAEFIEYASVINKNQQIQITQTDILLSLHEPLYLHKLNTDNFGYLIIKFFNSNINRSYSYSYENLQLIESVIRLWIISNNYFDKMSEALPLDYLTISHNQMIKINSLNDELNNANMFIEKMLIEFTSYLICDVNTDKFNISLSDSTIEYLRNSNLNFNLLKNKLIDAFKVARELSNSKGNIRIKRYYFIDKDNDVLKIKSYDKTVKSKDLNDVKAEISSKNNKPANTNKTEVMLDKYESVAEILISKNLSVLGKNIALHCTPPISPPALTDSINKHKKRIIYCLNNYPSRWILLRKHYKPIKNLIKD
ncbi:MAG: hypothetical protein IT243_00105 [Bacteroidia bacterium]|nr:hypothetical protein [Bacteroidia bacterium]